MYLANLTVPKTPFVVIELLIRHLHAMTKSSPVTVATAFRSQLKEVHESRINEDLRAGDLVMLTAVSTIFPTSDHFHPVVTPSMLVICKWLEQVVPASLRIMAIGSYMVTLCAQVGCTVAFRSRGGALTCFQYQTLSKRFVPEAVSFILKSLSLLAPVKQEQVPGEFTVHKSDEFRVSGAPKYWRARKLTFGDMFAPREDTTLALVQSFLGLLDRLASLWVGKTAFPEVFDPVHEVLAHLSSKECVNMLGPTLKVNYEFRSQVLVADMALETNSHHIQGFRHQARSRQTHSPSFGATSSSATAYRFERTQV
jgi:nucleolar protein 14